MNGKKSLINKSILVFILFAPIFLTISIGGDFSFNRYGGYEDVEGGTFPISLVAICILILINSIAITKELAVDAFGAFYLIISIFFLLLGVQTTVVVTSMLFFLAYYLMRVIFKSVSDAEKQLYLKIAFVSAFIPGVIVSILNIVFDEPQGFITEDYAIYNYEQYFAFTLILIQIFLNSLKFLSIKIIATLLSLLISINSENKTALILSICALIRIRPLVV
jgi:hypothetical protein